MQLYQCFNLNKFDPIKGIETSFCFAASASASALFKQIWPDQGDWNKHQYSSLIRTMLKFKQIWPDQGDWNGKASAYGVSAIALI